MTYSRSLAGMLTIVLTASTVGAPRAYAENVSASCTEKTYDLLAHEERLYRGVLFGQKQSEELPTGSVRFDVDFDSWMKVGANQWRTLDKDNAGLTWSDILMNEQADVQPRVGLFEVKKTPTSDLIPSLTQSMRALQCRMRAVCMAVRAAGSDDTPESVTVQPDGCLEFTFTDMSACKGTSFPEEQAGNCDMSVDAVIERESKLLHMVVAYDAAYRSLLQFAGIFEGFLADFRFPLLTPLWQMIRTMGALDTLPCFTGQCDE